MPEKVIIAMSGGVDSSAAAALMVDSGYECTGISLLLHNTGGIDFSDARQAAEKLGIIHKTLDYRDSFRDEVINYFVESYEQGYTPNPCIICNQKIKFGRLLSYLSETGTDFLASGHYAQIERSGSRFLLKKAADLSKDQSYVLYGLNQEKLGRINFPLGNLKKNEVREIAKNKGFINANKSESQDICFVPDGDYGSFIERYTGKEYPEGDILDINGNILGRHRGIIRYTLGQRRGLGVAVNHPVYVCTKDARNNTIKMGPETSLYSKTLIAENLNLIALEKLEKPLRVKAKTRYLHKEHDAWAIQTGINEIRIDFDEAQRAITPGQAVVFYDGDIVIGGGIIKKVV